MWIALHCLHEIKLYRCFTQKGRKEDVHIRKKYKSVITLLYLYAVIYLSPFLNTFTKKQDRTAPTVKSGKIRKKAVIKHIEREWEQKKAQARNQRSLLLLNNRI